jgi:16S rRNA (guanine527-N7)-methyltransferase
VHEAHLKKISTGAREMGVELSAEHVRLIARHIDLLLKWNKTINLTAITDLDEVAEKHVLDSLAIVPVLPSGSLLDVGTGGGFPGVPAAIVRPELEVVLVDSVQKKVAFLKNVLAELRLPNVRAQAARLSGDPAAEDLPRAHCAVARAFAAPVPWLTLAVNYVLPNGVAICMLGPGDAAPDRVGQMELHREMRYQLPFSKAERRLAIYRHVT